MRDERGRYISTAAIVDLGPEWASGCPSCEFGIVHTDLTGAVNLYLERIVQANESKGAIFCGCRAGVAARSNLRNVIQSRIEEARRGTEPGARVATTHSDITIAKQKVAEARAKSVPTVHFDERVTA
jgi:hypothetical protein